MATQVRTSATDPIRVDWVLAPELAGRLGLTFAPGKRQDSTITGDRWERDLDADLDRLRAHWGADVLVCLLEDAELPRLGIAPLMDRAAAHGLKVLRLPIPDGGLPADPEVARTLVGEVTAALRSGARVVVHCAGGLGRSGCIAGCCLVAAGLDPESALALLRDTRGPKCPENERQRAYVRAFAEEALRPVAAAYDRHDATLDRSPGAMPGEMRAALRAIVGVQRPCRVDGRPRPGLPPGMPTYGRVATALNGVILPLDLLARAAFEAGTPRPDLATLDAAEWLDALGLLLGVQAGLAALVGLLSFGHPPPFAPGERSPAWRPYEEALAACTGNGGDVRLPALVPGADGEPRAHVHWGACNWLGQGLGDVPGMAPREVLAAAALKLHALARFGEATTVAALRLCASPLARLPAAETLRPLETAQDFGVTLATTARVRAADLDRILVGHPA